MRVLTTVIAHPDSLTGSRPARLCVNNRRTGILSLSSALKKTRRRTPDSAAAAATTTAAATAAAAAATLLIVVARSCFESSILSTLSITNYTYTRIHESVGKGASELQLVRLSFQLCSSKEISPSGRTRTRREDRGFDRNRNRPDRARRALAFSITLALHPARQGAFRYSGAGAASRVGSAAAISHRTAQPLSVRSRSRRVDNNVLACE